MKKNGLYIVQIMMSIVCFIFAFAASINQRTAAAIMASFVGTSLLMWDVSDDSNNNESCDVR